MPTLSMLTLLINEDTVGGIAGPWFAGPICDRWGRRAGMFGGGVSTLPRAYDMTSDRLFPDYYLHWIRRHRFQPTQESIYRRPFHPWFWRRPYALCLLLDRHHTNTAPFSHDHCRPIVLR